MTIPAVAHFIWFGPAFPWAYGLALRSAALRGGFDRTILHHDSDLSATDGWQVATSSPGVETRSLNPEAVFEAVGSLGPDLVKVYRRLRQPAARANMVRAGILAVEGGVYLDTDTVTIASFDRLREAGVFCGVERLAMTAKIRRSRRPDVWALALSRLVLRDLFRRLPRGWRRFRYIEPSYPMAVNNAVFGAAPGHPFVVELLERMVTMPPSRQTVRYALGTALLQDMVADYAGDDLTVHPPETFYPLSPEISEHWFRFREPAQLEQVLSPHTCSVHWYASVRTKEIVPRIDAGYVRENAGRQLFSSLALPFI